VIDPQTEALLQAIVRRESRSLLLYVGAAFPWTTARGGPALDRLRQLIHEEADAVAALGRYLVRRRVTPPAPGAFPTAFTSYNFVALDYLLPRLAEAQRSAVAALEQDAAALRDPPARAEVKALLEVKRRTLAGLEALAAPAAATVGA
jgi:hypothetical protein